MKIGKTKFVVGAAMALSVALVGCGSTINSDPAINGPTTGVSGTDAAGHRYVGLQTCLECHAGFSWSADLVAEYLASKHNADQSLQQAAECVGCHDPVTDRTHAVTCEGCHGGGGDHYGVGAIPNPRPTPAECMTCHQLFDDEGEIVVTRHDPANDPTSTNMGRTIADTHHDDPATTTVIEGYAFDVNDPKACLRCHNPHSADLKINEQWARSGHGGRIAEIKEAAFEQAVEDGLTPAQVSEAVHNAGPEGETSSWPHYDWDNPSRVSCQRCHTATGSANFLSNPFHPKEKSGYDGSINYFSELNGWDPMTKTSGQNALLYCYGCHTDNKGGLRDPGPMPVQWNVVTGTAPAYTANTLDMFFPEAGKSNLCVGCHGGRGSQADLGSNLTPTTAVAPTAISQPKDVNGANIAWNATTPNPTMLFTNPTVSKTHYLPAAGTLFQANVRIGYEFSTGTKFLSYADMSSSANGPAFVHKAINQTTEGPCVTCHMKDEDHTFEPSIQTQNDITQNCNTTTCHDGGLVTDSSGNVFVGPAGKPWVNGSSQVVRPAPLTIATFHNYENGFNEALSYLKSLIQTRITDDTATTTQGAANPALGKKPVYDAHTNPYWLADLNGDGALTDADKITYSTFNDTTKTFKTDNVGYVNFTDWGNMGNMGAAMNYYYLQHEPGAFVHNARYAKRLVYDSIDWMQDGDIDSQTAAPNNTINLSAYPAAAAWIQGDSDTSNDNAVLRP